MLKRILRLCINASKATFVGLENIYIKRTLENCENIENCENCGNIEK